MYSNCISFDVLHYDFWLFSPTVFSCNCRIFHNVRTRTIIPIQQMNHGGEGVSQNKKGHYGFTVKLYADTDCTVLNRRPFSMNSYMLMDCR